MTSKRKMTFRAARSIVFGRLRAAGWDLDLHRVWPRALYTRVGGAVALYFKPQAIWFSAVDRGEPRRSDATTTGLDPRDLANMDEPAMVARLAAWCDREISRVYGGAA